MTESAVTVGFQKDVINFLLEMSKKSAKEISKNITVPALSVILI